MGAKAPLADFIMTEIDLLRRSAQWCDLFGDDAALLANGPKRLGGHLLLNGGPGTQSAAPRRSGRACCPSARGWVALAAADDWLNAYETDESAHKSRRWLREAPTERQLIHLPPEARADLGMDPLPGIGAADVQANKQVIRSLVRNAQPATLGQAA